MQAYFAEVSVQAISLRTDGIVRTVTSWDLLQNKFTLSANQLMKIKLASYSFKCDANRKYDQTVRRLNKLSESPIHFAFTTDYDDDIVFQNAHIAARICSRKKSARQCGVAKKGRCYHYTNHGHNQPTNTETIVLETFQTPNSFDYTRAR